MKHTWKSVALFLAVALLGTSLLAQTTSAARYDGAIQTKVTQKLADKKGFRINVKESTEDGIVTLSGRVELYQQKLDATKKVRKSADVQGVRNLIAVSTTVPDVELMAKLERKLYYDRVGYDNVFNVVDVSVKDGVATLS